MNNHSTYNIIYSVFAMPGCFDIEDILLNVSGSCIGF